MDLKNVHVCRTSTYCSGSNARAGTLRDVADNRVRFTAAGLTISKHGAIESVQKVGDNAARGRIVHFSLRGSGREHGIEGEDCVAGRGVGGDSQIR